MRKALNVLRYETVLEMLEDGPLTLDEIVENLQDKFPEKHIVDVVSQMMSKGYLNMPQKEHFVKVKDLFYKEL